MTRSTAGGRTATRSSPPTSRPAATTATDEAPGASADPEGNLKALILQAEQGNRAAYETLLGRLANSPGAWCRLGALMNPPEGTIPDSQIATTRLVSRKVYQERCAQMARELAGPQTSPLEHLLIDRIVACWLHLHLAETTYAMQGPGLSLPRHVFHEQRISAAHRRYLMAIRTLAQVRRLQVPSVQVNIAEQQLNVAAIAPGPTSQASAQRHARNVTEQ